MNLIPIDKADTLTRYYRVNSKKHISFGVKFLRFILRYLIPTCIIASVMIIGDIFLFNRSHYDIVIDMIIFIFSIIGMSFTATILSNLWFSLITKNQDEVE